MAWNMKTEPEDIAQVNMNASLSIALDKGAAAQIALTYFDDEGEAFGNGRARSLTLDADGVTLKNAKGQPVAWTPPVNSGKDKAAADAYYTSVVQALVDQGLVKPRR